MEKNSNVPRWRTDADNYQESEWKEHEDFGRENLEDKDINSVIPARRTWVSQPDVDKAATTASTSNGNAEKNQLLTEGKPDIVEKTHTSSEFAFISSGSGKTKTQENRLPAHSNNQNKVDMSDATNTLIKGSDGLHRSTSPSGWNDGYDDGDPHYNDSPEYGATSGAGAREYSGSSEGFALNGYSRSEDQRQLETNKETQRRRTKGS